MAEVLTVLFVYAIVMATLTGIDLVCLTARPRHQKFELSHRTVGQFGRQTEIRPDPVTRNPTR